MDSVTTIKTDAGSEYRVRMDKHGTFFLTVTKPATEGEMSFAGQEVELSERPWPWPPEIGDELIFMWVGRMAPDLPVPMLNIADTPDVLEYTTVEAIPREGATP